MQRLPAPELPAWLEPLVPFERYRVSVGRYAMHVMEHGAGRPILMVHGNPTWGFLYRRVVAELDANKFRVILPDLIGLGFSDKPRDGEEHQLEAHGRALGSLIEQLDLKDVLLVVQDWGGAIGLRAFVERSERLTGLVLLNTVVGPPKEGFRPTTFHRFARMPVLSGVAFRGLGFPQRALHLAQGDKSSIRGVVARAYRYPLRRYRDRIAPLALARMVPDSMSHPSIPALRRTQDLVTRLDIPMALVWGDRDPVLGRVRGHLQRLLPKAEVTVTDAGHFLQEEVPTEIAAAVRRVAGR